MRSTVESYIEFQKSCPSPFHVVNTVSKSLLSSGFSELRLDASWDLTSGNEYFVIHPEAKSIIAFRLADEAPLKSGFAIVGAHTDSPVLNLKVKPLANRDNYTLAQTQVHGSLIYRSWLDRPLVLAGKVFGYHKNPDGAQFKNGLPALHSRLVASSKPLAVIPDIAIHLDRDKNSHGAINPESLLQALLGASDTINNKSSVARLLHEREDFDAFELCFAPFWPHQVVGVNDEFVIGPRHDDLAMVFTALRALEEESSGTKTMVAAFFDSEETGSESPGGASSYFILDVLKRICEGHPKAHGAPAAPIYGQALAQSLLLSADVVHGVHPCYPDKHDLNHRPLMNEGPVVKVNTNDRYATSGQGVALFKALCHHAKIPSQDFVIRQDLACGSTIGPILGAKLGCLTVDVGVSTLGMHSACETMGVRDLGFILKLFKAFYSG